jgi:hypothetical protein
LLEPLGLAIELGKHGRAGVLDLVLRAARPEPFREVAPESVQAGVSHFKEAAHELRALPIEEHGGFRRIAISRFVAISLAFEKSKRHQRVDKIGIGTRVQLKRRLEFGARPGRGPEFGEEPELYRGEQDLGRPEGHADFHDSSG